MRCVRFLKTASRPVSARASTRRRCCSPVPWPRRRKRSLGFATAARGLNAQSIRIIATSAARDAKNPGDLTAAVEQASGLKTDFISGEQEADWAFQGVTSDPRLAHQPLLLLDVGGGSADSSLGHGEQKDFRHSFPLGSVRLLEKFPVSDPPTPEEFTRLRVWLQDFC